MLVPSALVLLFLLVLVSAADLYKTLERQSKARTERRNPSLD